MKKAFCLILALLLLLLAGCGKKDVSGLGSLSMDNMNSGSSAGGIGTLGQPTAAPDAPTETAPPSAPDVPQVPVPAETPVPTAPPEPEGMQTEVYSCQYFTVTKPVDWEVRYNAFKLEDGESRLTAYIYDPANANNMIFYLKIMEPYFGSLEMKNLFLSYPVESIFEWSPVLGEINAESVLREWASSYTMMEIAGDLENLIPFRNYHVEEVLKTFDGGMNGDSVVSAVLAEVSIPGTDTTYGMFFQDSLTPTWIPNTSIMYYKGYDTIGFVADPEVFNNYCDVLNDCKNSFDFSGFRSQYGITAECYENPFEELGEFTVG